MAQIIQCDAHNLEHRADWLVTRLEDGEVMAYCNAGYFELMSMTVEATNREEADETDRDAQARLEAVQAPAAADTFDPSEGSPDPIQAEPTGDDMGIGVTHIIHRGQSARAIGFREREAEREAAQAVTATAEPGDDEGDEPDDDDVDPGATPPA